jgi:hypothetical protein
MIIVFYQKEKKDIGLTKNKERERERAIKQKR